MMLKRTYYLVGLLFLTSFTSMEEPNVYICKGENLSIKYHLRLDCHALKKCKGEIYTLKRDLAEKRGRTLCGYEKDL